MLNNITKATHHGGTPEEQNATQLLKHFAIALKMDETRGLCPQVTVKARGKMVEHLLELAKKNGVPIEENPQLVEGLKFLECGQYVPESFFPLLAEIMSHVESIRRHLEQRS
jgi:flagellar biosynthesis protein